MVRELLVWSSVAAELLVAAALAVAAVFGRGLTYGLATSHLQAHVHGDMRRWRRFLGALAAHVTLLAALVVGVRLLGQQSDAVLWLRLSVIASAVLAAVAGQVALRRVWRNRDVYRALRRCLVDARTVP